VSPSLPVLCWVGVVGARHSGPSLLLSYARLHMHVHVHVHVHVVHVHVGTCACGQGGFKRRVHGIVLPLAPEDDKPAAFVLAEQRGRVTVGRRRSRSNCILLLPGKHRQAHAKLAFVCF